MDQPTPRHQPSANRLVIVIAMPVIAWTLFALGSYRTTQVESWSDILLYGSPLGLMLGLAFLWYDRHRWVPGFQAWLDRHTDAVDSVSTTHIGWWIALAAGAGLFGELMIIRLHASYFQLFAYFKNVSLLSCFLGLGIGYLVGPRRPLTTPLALPMLGGQIAIMALLRHHPAALALQKPVSEELALGIGQIASWTQGVTSYGFLLSVFLFNTACFVPLGQLASFLMARCGKLVAYGWNLTGSLGGILLFNLLAFGWTPPAVWVAVFTIMMILLLRGRMDSLLPSVGVAVGTIALLATPLQRNQLEIFSPYQVLTLEVARNEPPRILVNNVYFQRILDLRGDQVMDPQTAARAAYYELPYQFHPGPERVMVVGSGTGNDVAAALRFGVAQVDAVEIDPAILRMGIMLHPESPYQRPNVHAVVDDARSFIRNTQEQYDLIVYGLLDSHTLLSARAGVRLDSFVYTVEALREARARLREGGLLSLTFSILTPEMGRKLYRMLEAAFDGQPPLVYTTPYDGGYAFLAGDGIRNAGAPTMHEDLRRSTLFASPDLQADVSTDDWPFLYMPRRTYPKSYVWMILILFAVSYLMISAATPSRSGVGSPACFFLGAGFMLVETKTITELAIVFGSTWIVTGIVIASILVMAFLANLVVIRRGTPPRSMAYGLLLVSLLVGMWVSTSNPAWAGPLLLTVLLTLPLFFSGFAFSTELAGSKSVAAALSSNLFGAMLGGFLEYNAMYFGFRSLHVLAIVMYGAAWLAAVWPHRGTNRGVVPAPVS